MKTRLAALLIVIGTVLCTSGCGSSLPPFVQAALVFETGTQIAVSTAQEVWPGIVTLLPVAQQGAANTAFQDAVVSTNDADAALNDVVIIDEQANSPTPNLATLTQAVSDALDQLLNVVNQFKGDNPPSGLAKLTLQIASAKKQLKRIHR